MAGWRLTIPEDGNTPTHSLFARWLMTIPEQFDGNPLVATTYSRDALLTTTSRVRVLGKVNYDWKTILLIICDLECIFFIKEEDVGNCMHKPQSIYN